MADGLRGAMLAAAAAAAAAAIATAATVRCAAPTGQRQQLHTADEPAAADDCSESLRVELQGLRLRQLRQRAVAEGLDDDAVEDALDEEHPKAALIDLVFEHAARRGPAERALSALEAGGEACAVMVGDVLDHALDLLEALMLSSPRKARRPLLEAAERVEAARECVEDAAWCDGVSRCGRDELDRLSGVVVCVRGLSSSSDASEASSAVISLVECLDRCGSVVVQSVDVLSAAAAGTGTDDASGSAGVLRALESLRGLSEARTESVCADEAAAFEAVQHRLSGLDACDGDEVVSGCMALFSLGCRNGAELCGTVEAAGFATDLCVGWAKSLSASMSATGLTAGAAIGAVNLLGRWECVPKLPLELRRPLEAVYSDAMKTIMGMYRELLSEQSARAMLVESMKIGLLCHDDMSLACGQAEVVFNIGYCFPGALPEADEAGMFGEVLALCGKVEPSPLSGGWWVSTYDVVDVTSARLSGPWLSINTVRFLPSPTQASWWTGLLDRAICIAKVNAAFSLSGHDTMCYLPVLNAFNVLEVAAKHESQHRLLIDSNVVDALECGMLSEFTVLGTATAAYASGAAVALVGRNEGGKVLRREAVHAVLEKLWIFFDPNTLYHSAALKTILSHFARVPTMAISDANKKHMLQYQPLVDLLLACLMIDDESHIRGQDGADKLQEMSCGVLHELSLFGPGADLLRSRVDVASSLGRLWEVGTKVSKERASAALFELEQDKRPKIPAANDDGTGTGLPNGQQPPHIMASYNWDHQDVILRVVESLQRRGYLVWVDTEQMKGAAVDAMALAVEGSEVILIGVSRAYKESSNCRMEAQYALQKKKSIVPLMLVEGYEADGWLGLLLGTSIWYALYGETVANESAFDGRMDALCREIGHRGRADALAFVESSALDGASVALVSGELEPEPAEASELMQELRALKMAPLMKRALSAGVDAATVDASLDKHNGKQILIDIIVECESNRDPAERTVLCLTEGGISCAAMVSDVLDHGMEVLEQLSVSSPRKSRKRLLEIMTCLEAALEHTDVEWCDGVSRCALDQLVSLGNQLSLVHSLSSKSAAAAAIDAVADLLDGLDQCGNPVLQSLAVLRSGGGDASSSDRIGAFEVLRGLSEDHLEVVSTDECAACGVITKYLASSTCAGVELESACASLFTLCCRNGFAVCATTEMVELSNSIVSDIFVLLGSSSTVDVLRAGGAACAWSTLTSYEAVYKSPSDVRVSLEVAAVAGLKHTARVIKTAFATPHRGHALAREMLKAGMMEDTCELSTSCGALFLWGLPLQASPSTLRQIDDDGCFMAAAKVHQRVEPSPLPASWWVSTCGVIDATSARLNCEVSMCLSGMKRLAAMSSKPVRSITVWLSIAIKMVKTNLEGGLSERDTMNPSALYQSLCLVEIVARQESQQSSILESGVVDALEYTCLNDFFFLSQTSLAAVAAGGLVALLGRNEGGKLLSRASIFAVVDSVANCFQIDHYQMDRPVAFTTSIFARVATICISDANKRLMVEHGGLMQVLLHCLMLDDSDPRKGQDGADKLQESCAGVLQELALFKPGANLLRSHAYILEALKTVAKTGTSKSKERASAALFELEQDKRPKIPAANDDGTGTGLPNGQQPPHIMASYNWDHQDVILRVVESLQRRGYLVWVDTEQMKGAAVDAMALAVEGSEVILIGVSRAYKESSNCRMEAQYALQKKKSIIPLMLVEGYEADGWLGLLLGTSMWYGFYGDALDSASVFDGRMDALCREIGGRGCADALVVAAGTSSSSRADVAEATRDVAGQGSLERDETVRDELQGLRLKQLRERAKSEGVDEDAVGDALDTDNPKAALIRLLLYHMASRGPVDRILTALVGGGDACEEAIASVLEHAADVLEALSAASPRKSRRSLLDMSDRVEGVLESLDAEWCDGVSRCGQDEMGHLSGLLACVGGLSSSSASVSDASCAVTAVLNCLDRCGSVAVQSMAVLFAGDAGESAVVLSALESLRGLSEDRLDRVCADEAAVYEVVLGHLSGMDGCIGAEVVSTCMALHTLGCRNGLAVCGNVATMNTACGKLTEWLEYAARGGDDYEAGAASGAIFTLVALESGPKLPPESCDKVGKGFTSSLAKFFAAVGKAFTDQSAQHVYTGSMKVAILHHKDISLACGFCFASLPVGYSHQAAVATANEVGMFSAALDLHRRVEPSALPGEWWSETCHVVDVTSARLSYIWTAVFGLVKYLPSVAQSSWWSELLDHAIRMAKLNASAGLSERGRMSLFSFLQALGVVEVAARDESQHDLLLASGVADALEYGILHDVTYASNSIAAYASGAAVALVGRNEGGKVLRREAVHAVLHRLRNHFQPESGTFAAPTKIVMTQFRRITIMAISDANKKHMLQFEPLIDTLLQCLVIDDANHRKGQDGADELQQASAGVLHELSLYGPGAAALRSHGAAVSTLQKLCEVGTKVSKERGAAALFELEDDSKRVKRASSGTDDGAGTGLVSGGQKPPPHVMASYNWDHQDVILRVVESLQRRGYLVWVDTEQMKGATVDTMALAVEGSAVVMIGVSRAYKESSNCRMEAQYALQKKKSIVPLMLVEGYEADGWLGLLLGTSMWYALYGETVANESAFEARMDALCREIGHRGRADALAFVESSSLDGVSVALASGELEPEPAEASELMQELRGLRLTALRKRAAAQQLPEDDIDEALEAGDSKSALIQLLIEHEESKGPVERVHAALEAGGELAANVIRASLDQGIDALEKSAMASPRGERRPMRAAIDRAETLLDSVDVAWCGCMRGCGASDRQTLADLLVRVQGRLGLEDLDEDATAVSLRMTALLDLLDKTSVAAEPAVHRDDLVHMKLGALLRRAVSEGIEAAALEEAEDAADPRAAIIALLLPTNDEASAASTLREELGALKTSALLRRAIAAGVGDEALEGVDEADDDGAKAKVIELIVSAE